MWNWERERENTRTIPTNLSSSIILNKETEAQRRSYPSTSSSEAQSFLHFWHLQGIIERAVPINENLLCARHCPKCFASGSYFIFQQPYVVGTVLTCLFQMRNIRLGEGWPVVQLHLHPKQSGCQGFTASLFWRPTMDPILTHLSRARNRNKGWSFQSKRSKYCRGRVKQETQIQPDKISQLQ